jgi:tetratricopeptide (TPR) repeat protein
LPLLGAQSVEAALRGSPDDPWLLQRAAFARFTEGRFDEAAQALRRCARAQDGDDASCARELAWLDRRSSAGDLSRWLSEAEAGDGAAAWRWIGLARWARARGRLALAADCLESAGRLIPRPEGVYDGENADLSSALTLEELRLGRVGPIRTARGLGSSEDETWKFLSGLAERSTRARGGGDDGLAGKIGELAARIVPEARRPALVAYLIRRAATWPGPDADAAEPLALLDVARTLARREDDVRGIAFELLRRGAWTRLEAVVRADKRLAADRAGLVGRLLAFTPAATDQGGRAKAIERLDFAARLAPADADAERIALEYVRLRDWTRAATLLRERRSDRLRSSVIGRLLGEPHLAVGPIDRGLRLERFLFARRLARTEAEWARIVAAHVRLGDWSGADAAVLAARSVRPQARGLARLLIAEGLRAQRGGDRPLAARYLAWAETADVERAASVALAGLALQAQEWARARALLDDASRRARAPDGEGLAGLLEGARAAAGAGKASLGVETLTLAERLRPNEPELAAVAQQWMDLGQPRRSLPLLDRLVASDAGNARLRSDRGVCYARLGKLDEAAAELRTAVSLDPALLPAYLSLGFVYTRQGRRAQAREIYDQALSGGRGPAELLEAARRARAELAP